MPGRQHNPAPPFLMKLHEAAEILAVTAPTVRRWADLGLIRMVVLPSGQIRVYRADIADILNGKHKELVSGRQQHKTGDR